ncbi:MAG: cellulose binding domain-containing protein [Ketobacter sp.]
MKKGSLLRIATTSVLAFGSLTINPGAMADELCELSYNVVNDWGTGATHKINFTYNGPDVEGWQLTWTFPGSETILDLWGGAHQQSGNSVVVNNVSWNSTLSAGKNINVGFNIKNPSQGELPTLMLNGTTCDTVDGSTPPVTPPQEPPEENPDETPEVPPVTPPDMENGSWTLDSDSSYFHFVSYKNQDKVESHSFERLSGSVAKNGSAVLEIDLNSVSTGNNTRDQRMRDMLFETAMHGTAVVSMDVDPDAMAQLNPGQRSTLNVNAALQLHGLETPLTTQLFVQRLTDTRYMVQNVSPVLVKASDYSLEAGIEALRQIAGLNAISTTVPVDFVLYYDLQPTP